MLGVNHLAASILALALFLSPALARAAVGCGDVLAGANTLDADLDCVVADGDAALTLTTGAALDMQGHRLTCTGGAPEGDGIRLIGFLAKLQNGWVEQCSTGVVLAGIGFHGVQNVLASRSGEHGFAIESHFNLLQHNAAVDGESSSSVALNDESSAFAIYGNHNKLRDNTASSNDDDGFVVDGDHNELTWNVAADHADGFKIDGSENTLSQNVSSGNEDYGFQIGGLDNELMKNVAIDNGFAGFSVEQFAHGNQLLLNTATDNGQGGFGVAADENLLLENRAYANLDEDQDTGGGIKLTDEAQDNQVGKSVALGNEEFDLSDENFVCDDNLWKLSIFGSSEVNGGVGAQTCIE